MECGRGIYAPSWPSGVTAPGGRFISDLCDVGPHFESFARSTSSLSYAAPEALLGLRHAADGFLTPTGDSLAECADFFCELLLRET